MRTVYACSLRFQTSIEDTWTDVAAWISGWYANREHSVVLPSGWELGSSEPIVTTQGHSLEVTLSKSSSDESELREVRWRYPDQYDPSLMWASDVAVYADSQEVLFTLAVRIASVDFDLRPAKFELGTPRIVRSLVARGGAKVGSTQLPKSYLRVDPSTMPKFVALLLDNGRRLPVVVLSVDLYSERLSTNPEVLAKTLAGTAVVAVLTSKWAAFALTEELGKQFSCFGGAVRIYWPRFNPQAHPFFHRLWLPPEVARADAGQGFAVEMLRLIAPAAAFRFVEPEKVRTFRQTASQSRLDALRSKKTQDYEELFALWDEAEKKCEELQLLVDKLTTENATFRDNFNAIWMVPPKAEDGITATPEQPAEPEVTSVEGAIEEARSRTKYLHFLPDAIQSAKASPFKQPQKALNALLAIDEVAGSWLLSIKGKKGAFKERGFDYADDISKTTRGKWGKEYMYKYEGETTSFEPHITIGAKQADKCLSIHMHWDEKRGRVVIAHVGRHKSNTTS